MRGSAEPAATSECEMLVQHMATQYSFSGNLNCSSDLPRFVSQTFMYSSKPTETKSPVSNGYLKTHNSALRENEASQTLS